MLKQKTRSVKSCIFLFFWIHLSAENTSVDIFKFGKMWPSIKQLEENTLYEMILQRQIQITASKEHWKEKLPELQNGEFFQKLYHMMQSGTLIAVEPGFGATYFLLDQTQTPQFVIKPCDESILCLNNPKQYGSPYNQLSFRVRENIPLYRSAQTEALSSAFAAILGMERLTPETHLAVISHEQFFNIGDNLTLDQWEQVPSVLKKADREKLCSIQAYVPGIENLCQLAKEWLQQNLSEDQIFNLIDQTDLEDLFLLIWLLYDTDAHTQNIYARKDSSGVYHLIKLDNGLTFPDKNGYLFNALALLPQAKSKLSERAVAIIQMLPLQELIEQIRFFEMEQTLDAFQQRSALLQQLVREKTHSIREIDTLLCKFGTTALE